MSIDRRNIRPSALHTTLSTKQHRPEPPDPRRTTSGRGARYRATRVQSTPTKNAVCKETTCFLGVNIKLEFVDASTRHLMNSTSPLLCTSPWHGKDFPRLSGAPTAPPSAFQITALEKTDETRPQDPGPLARGTLSMCPLLENSFLKSVRCRGRWALR